MTADDMIGWQPGQNNGRKSNFHEEGSAHMPRDEEAGGPAWTNAGERIHAFVQEQAERDALTREGQVHKWLREHWPWYVRWAIGYPRAIRVLDRLGLVTLPVFVERRVIGEVPQQLKTSTKSDWTIQVYGYDVKLHGRAWSLGPDGRRIDVPLTPGMFDGHAVLILDPGPIAEAINEWELRGRTTCPE